MNNSESEDTLSNRSLQPLIPLKRPIRWPQFWGIVFQPKSLGSTDSGGVIEKDEPAAEAIRSDLEYLLNLFELVCREPRLSGFWSQRHQSWVFYSKEKIRSLEIGTRGLFSFSCRPFKKRGQFYEEILGRELECQRIGRKGFSASDTGPP